MAIKVMDIMLYRAAASEKDDATAFDALLANKGIVNSEILNYKTSSGDTLLHVASSRGNHLIVSSILSHNPHMLTSGNHKGDTALHLAARCGCVNVVNALRAIKGMSRAVNKKGNTAAHEALISRHLQIARSLINDDLRVLTMPNNEGKTPLYLIVEAETVNVVTDMLNKIKDVEELRRGLPLMYPVIMRRRTDLIDIILDKDAELIRSRDGQGYAELIRSRDGQGRMVLHYAAFVGYFDGVVHLIGRDASCVIERDNDGLFPAHLAARKGHVSVLKKLLEKEHSPDAEEIVARNGNNILHEAADLGKNDVVKYILNSPMLEALINQQNEQGNTPLHLATIKCNPKIVSTMTWDARVDLKIVNNDGYTVVDAAEHNPNTSPNTFHMQLTWYALISAGGTRAHRDEIPMAPRNVGARGQTSRQDFNSTAPRNAGNGVQGREDPNQSESQYMDGYKDRANTLLIVATLVATITFAAGCTMPGGYDQTSGIALLLHHHMFSVFVFCDSVALYSSITVAVTLIWSQLGDFNLVASALTFSLPLLGLALTSMSVAFMAGTYVTIWKLGLLHKAALIMGGIFLAAILMLFFPLCLSLGSRNFVLRCFTYIPFRVLIFLSDGRNNEDKDVN